MPEENENYVTQRELAGAFEKFGDKVAGQIRESVTELRTQIAADRAAAKSQADAAVAAANANKPSQANYLMWTGLILGIIYFLWGKESAAIDKKFDLADKKVEQAVEMIFRIQKENKSAQERTENWIDTETRDKIRRADELLWQGLIPPTNGRQPPQQSAP